MKKIDFLIPICILLTGCEVPEPPAQVQNKDSYTFRVIDHPNKTDCTYECFNVYRKPCIKKCKRYRF